MNQAAIKRMAEDPEMVLFLYMKLEAQLQKKEKGFFTLYIAGH
jgi:hypothetical protein